MSLMGVILLPQQLLLGSLALGTLLYLVAHMVHLDRLDQANPTLSPARHKPGVLHGQCRGNATRGRRMRRLPHAIIIGVRKGGTRALLEMLGLHPAVVKASREVHFFDRDAHYARGVAWYRGRMPFSVSDQVTIEKSPAYFTTDKVPERIFTMNASTKLLVIVREPVTRAVSDYTQVLELKRHKNKTYPRFEELVMDGATCQVNVNYKAVRTSVYSKHLERWLEFFPVQQLHVVDGDRLIWDALPELRMVEQFLDLPPRIGPSNLYFNATRGFYCLRSGTRPGKCLAGSKGREHPPVDPAVLEKLRRFFRPFNQKFYQITGRTFAWP